MKNRLNSMDKSDQHLQLQVLRCIIQWPIIHETCFTHKTNRQGDETKVKTTIGMGHLNSQPYIQNKLHIWLGLIT